MALIFRCNKCKKLKFLQSFQLLDNIKYCNRCYHEIRKRLEAEEQKKLIKKLKHEERLKRRREQQRKIDQQLLEQIRLENIKNQEKSRAQHEKRQKTNLKHQNMSEKNKVHLSGHLSDLQKHGQQSLAQEQQSENISQIKNPNKPKQHSLLKNAEKLSMEYDKVLYVYADVKRIKVIEWVSGKKRVALNKEREIRRTHKGGWSQEKYQRFIDAKKAKVNDWLETELNKQGILKPSYDKVIIDASNKDIKDFLESFFNNKF